MICPEFRVHQRGVERVDSYVFDAHKWMFTNFDCSVFWVADRAPLIRTMSILPPYLQNAASASGRGPHLGHTLAPESPARMTATASAVYRALRGP